MPDIVEIEFSGGKMDRKISQAGKSNKIAQENDIENEKIFPNPGNKLFLVQ